MSRRTKVAPISGNRAAKYPVRAIRVSEEIWVAAQAVAVENDETLSDVIRRALIQYTEQEIS